MTLIEQVNILNFRNYEKLKINNLTNFNIIIGKNGSGKTNLLEAIFVSLRNYSFRTKSLIDCIKWNSDSFYIKTILNNDIFEIGYTKTKKLVKYNKTPVSKNFYPVCLMLPEDIEIVCGDPESRRNLIDDFLIEIDKDYSLYLNNYNKVLKERNAQIKYDKSKKNIWNNELIKYGSYIIEKRILLIQSFQNKFKLYYNLIQNFNVDLKYLNTFRIINNNIKESFLKFLLESSELEDKNGWTIIGPHRDNFYFEFKDHNFKYNASQGQKRTAILIIKLIMAEILKERFSLTPVILIDDAILELDKDKQIKFFELLKDKGQIFLTITEKEFNFNFENLNIIKIGE